MVYCFFILFMMPVIGAAQEAENTAIPSISGDSEADPCKDAVEICPVSIPSPDTGPSNAQPPTVVGNPISLVTGNKYQREQDYGINGSVLEFSRNYNSARTDFSSGLGQGWSGTFSSRIANLPDGGHVVTDSSGRAFTFDVPEQGTDGQIFYRASSAANGYVTQVGNQSNWTMPDGRTLSYQGSYLVSVDYPGHQSIKLFYQNKKLASVTDDIGRVLKFEYTDNQAGLSEYTTGRFMEVPGYLKRIVLPDSSNIEYQYDSNRNLARVLFEDGTSTEYHYENEVYPNHLTGITDRLGNRYASWEYNDAGLAISSEHAAGVERVTIEYEFPESYNDIGTTYVTNSLGYVSVYRWQRLPSGDILLLSTEGPGCATCPPANMTYSYTTNNQLATSTNTAGNTRRYFYDDKGRIEKIDRTSQVNAVPVLEVRYEYDKNGVYPVRIFKPSVNSAGEYELAVTYNSDGLPEEFTESGFAPLVPSAVGQLTAMYKPVSRTTRLSYLEGRVSEVDGPRVDVDDKTRFSYDQLGRLIRMELPSGEVVAIDKYDEHGRALEFRRAQHPPVNLQYDDYGNVRRITQLGQSVEYVYNAENKLIRVTNPNGKTSTLSYDESQRLVGVTDDLGRTVSLTLNSESQEQNRTFLGVNGSVINSMNYVFDAEGRIQSFTEEQTEYSNGKMVANTTELEYGTSGQLIGARNAETGNQMSLVFNELGRLLNSVSSNGLSVKKEYDTQDRLVAQTDKRLNSTRYYRDDFGQIRFLVSQDTGVTKYEYDVAGNRTKKVNADGDVTHYRWDAANRLVEQRDIDGNTNYLYDGTNGRLLQTSNPYITERYTYTPFAQLKKHTRVIDGHNFTTEYVYEANGKIRNKILPDGQSLRYHYHESGPDNGNLRAITREGLFGLRQSTLLGEIDLDWRDGESSYLSHNGRRNEVQYHADGKVSSVSVSDTLSLEYDYDERGNIVGIRQNGFDQRYEYNAGQLSGARTLKGNYEYKYDVTGNRTAATAVDSSNNYRSALNYLAVSKGNRLQTWLDTNSNEQVNYRYNESGSPVAIGDLRYEYNADQRPVKVMRDGNLVAEYSYNSFGERIKKVTYGQNQKTVTYFLYDNRTLVAEIDGATLEHRQTVYLKHTPVAHLIGNSAYAVHTDNLGTPKLLTNDDGDTVWQAGHTPLGKAVIETQDIEFNFRLPGQYADSETGTHYNYLRDYDPKTGRYLTSDPAGLDGGDNTYAYANNNVLGLTDVLGLSPQLPNIATQASVVITPFSAENATNAVQNPNTLPPDVAELGVTDPNQLITIFDTRGGPCRSSDSFVHYNHGINRLTASLHGQTNGLMLSGDGIQAAIDDLRQDSVRGDENELPAQALEELLEAGATSVLIIPVCASDEQIRQIVKNNLGELVSDAEINGIIASLGPKVTVVRNSASGDIISDPQTIEILDEAGQTTREQCTPAGIVDVTDLHAEIHTRVQVLVMMDPRVIAAQREMLLAQQEFEDFLRNNPDIASTFPPIDCVNDYGANIQYCTLMNRAMEAAERYAQTLNTVYDEMKAAGKFPPFDTRAEEEAFRKAVFLGILSVFIPTSATDLALEALTLGFSRVGNLFEGAGSILSAASRGNRVGIEGILAQGTVAAQRANTLLIRRDYPDYPALQNMDYQDLVHVEQAFGPDKLRKLNEDAALNPNLADDIADNPDYLDTWNYWDDLGETEMRQRFAEIEGTAKGSRPDDPSEYLSQNYIDNHVAQFDGGATRFITSDSFNQYGVGKPDGTEYVMPKAEADRLLAETGGDPYLMAEALGLPRDTFVNSPLVRIDFDNPGDLNVRVPNGNEFGTDETEWIPGGVLPNGALEAVVDVTSGSWTHELIQLGQ